MSTTMIGFVKLVILLAVCAGIDAGTLRGAPLANETALLAFTTPAAGNSSTMGRELVQSRRLETLDFVPLICNRKLDRVVCSKWSQRIGKDTVYSKRITIECGECVIMDHPGANLTLANGLDVRGKLIFPDGYKLHMISTMIVVQGHLEMSATKQVDGLPSIKFTTIVNNDEQFFPMGENKGKCGGETFCTVGKKSITVAGGKVASKCFS